MGRYKNREPYKYRPEFHDAWAFSLSIKGATDEEIAEAFGVNRKTINRWSYTTNDKGEDVLTSFGEALLHAKEQADAQVVKKLFERCMGYDVEEEQKTIDVNKDGSSKIGQIRTVKKHIPPDTMAMMYWLNNRSRKTGEWSQRQEVSVGFGDDSIREAVRELSLEEARAKLTAIRSEIDDEE
jgi:hypothetical protein